MKIKKLMRKISFSIPVKVVASISVVMIILCGILSTMLSQLTTDLVERQMQLLADENAQIATKYLEAMHSQSKALSSEFSRYISLDQETAEALVENALYSVLDDHRIFSSYAAFEPNAFFPDTDEGLSFYAYRDGNSIVTEVLNDYDDYITEEYYAVSKNTREGHITEPYSYQLSNGETVWLTTISNPIFDEKGNFIGVSNCDILTDTLNNLSYDLNNYNTAYSYILTNNANYVTHTADKSLFGTAFKQDDPAVLDAVTTGKQLTVDGENEIFGGDAFEIYVPLKVEGINQNWSSAFVVNKSEAMASSQRIVFSVIGIALMSVIILTVVTIYLLNKSLKPVSKIVYFAKELGNGNLSSELDITTDDEFGDIASSLKNTMTILGSYIKEISEILSDISNYNLNLSVERDYVGDFSPIKTALLEIIQSLNATMESIDIASGQVSLGASQVSTGAQALAQGATEQAATIEELSASIAGVSDGVQDNANNVHEAAEYMEQTMSVMGTSNTYMQQMLNSMDEIKQASEKIGRIIKIIDDIAFQTNILALNAAVEAARAGTAGKGFAVVADEVRNLASKSSDAAKQTSALIEGSINAVLEGARIAEETAKSLESTMEKSMHVSDIIEKIDHASSAQAEAITQITQGLAQVSMVVQTNSATAEESAAASEELSGQAEMMHREVAKFERLAANRV